MPKAIKLIGTLIPEEVSRLYEKYPFDIYGIPYLVKELRKYGIKKNKLEYDECFDTAMLGYMYSVHRCAYMNYAHIENYIRFMIRCCIKMGVVIANKEVYARQSENYKVIYLDNEVYKNIF